jgi:hypothetical protein
MHSSKLRRWVGVGEAGYSYWCQGCKERHSIPTEGPKAWTFNGDMERPVFAPSVLVRTGHYASHYKAGDPCWCTHNAEMKAAGEEPSGFECKRCHTFIGCNGAQPGEVVFLGDCTHALAGTVQAFPDLPPHTEDA